MWLRWIAFPVLAACRGRRHAGLALAGFVLLLAYPNLPSIEALTDYQPKIPLRVYTADGVLIGEFGEERRSVVRIDEVPPLMKQAILAAEDERFYQHTGVDYHGRAAGSLLQSAHGRQAQGASHHHHAGGAKLLPLQREDPDPQALRGAACLQDRSTA